MTAHADAIAKPPRTLTDLEQKLILKTTGEHHDGFRDHVLISLALGTEPREHELLALDMGDVFDDGRGGEDARVLATGPSPRGGRRRRRAGGVDRLRVGARSVEHQQCRLHALVELEDVP